MDDNDLLHPNLLRNDQLIHLIRERQLNINNLENLSRNELLDVFKKYILPKPQRQKKGCNSQSQEISSTNTLVNEVKRIKINHTMSSSSISQVHHIERRDNNLKRNHEDHSANDNKQKRQRIQWP